jgi:hypothetical protein
LKIPLDFCGGEATSSQSSGFLGKACVLRGCFLHAVECYVSNML